MKCFLSPTVSVSQTLQSRLSYRPFSILRGIYHVSVLQLLTFLGVINLILGIMPQIVWYVDAETHIHVLCVSCWQYIQNKSKDFVNDSKQIAVTWFQLLEFKYIQISQIWKDSLKIKFKRYSFFLGINVCRWKFLEFYTDL